MSEKRSIYQIFDLVRDLSIIDQLGLAGRINAHVLDQLRDEQPANPEHELSPQEIEELLSMPNTPLNSQEIAESGLLGAWKDKGITDSVEWLEEQRRQRRDN